MIVQRPADESAAEALVQALCRMVDEIESTPERRALLVRLLTERPSMRAYQRTTLVEHTEERVIATLAARAGKEPDRKSTRLNSSHSCAPRMPSLACKTKSNTIPSTILNINVLPS